MWWPESPSPDIVDKYAKLTVTGDFSVGTMVLQAPVGDGAFTVSKVIAQIAEAKPLFDAIPSMA